MSYITEPIRQAMAIEMFNSNSNSNSNNRAEPYAAIPIELTTLPLPTSPGPRSPAEAQTPTEEEALKAFKQRYGANKTPAEHRAAWQFAHANDPRSSLAGPRIHYPPMPPPPKEQRATCTCGMSCVAM